MPTLALMFLSVLALPSSEPHAQREIDTDRVDAIFAEYDRTDGPGVALGIVSEGELVYARGYGMANLEHDIPLAPDTVLRIGSTSKQFTAACAVLAEQQGALSLDADIRTYLPELPAYDKPITTRHLLHHTSGIRDYLTLMALVGYTDDDHYTNEAVLEMIARQQSLNFPTGTQHLYSNSGYFLVSVILERATGKTLSEFAEEFLFGPLGMSHSHFHDDYTLIVKKRADGHARGADGEWHIANTTLEMCGDGGVFTSVEDMLLWDANFYEPKVGGQALVDALLTHGRLDDGTELEYALGLGVRSYRGLKLIAHGGAFVGFRAETIRFPDQKLSVIVFANLAEINPSGLALQVADVVLAEEFAAAPATAAPRAAAPNAGSARTRVALSDEQLEHFAASYLDAASGNLVELVRTEGGLALRAGAQSVVFEPTSEVDFAAREGRGSLSLRPSAMEGFWEGTAVIGDAALVLRPYLPWDPSFMTAEDYAGSYRCAELATGWTLEFTGEGLVLLNALGAELALSPLGIDAFRGDVGILAFERDPFQAITGFRLNAGRVLGLEFVRVE